MLFPKENWIKIRRQLLKQVKEQVRLRLGEDPTLSKYYMNYKSEFKGRWSESHESSLFKAFNKSQVVLGGDFHAYSQSQRTHLRILRKINGQKKVVLALECIEAKYQKDVDKYLQGKISENTFVRRIQWQKNWGFPWEHYRPLFNLCRERGYPVVALNELYRSRNIKTLSRRDSLSAKRIVQAVKKYPDSLIYCIYGDMHLAQPHLPKKIKALNKNITLLTLFQNSEDLYFRLARQNIENKVDVLKGSKNRFCIIGSPPWVKWQSYLMFLEKNFDTELFEEDDEILDYTDYVGAQIDFLAQDLGTEINKDELAVYSSDNEIIKNKLQRIANKEKGRVVKYHIENDKSYYVPEDGYMYLSRLTVNHAAELAGSYIQAQLSQRKTFIYRMPEDFLKKIWIEGLCFFSSKLINHKRKSESMLDLKIQLSKTSLNNRGQEALLLALDQRLCEILMLQGHKNITRKIKPKNKAVYLESARILGQMLGDRIYKAYREKLIDTKEVQKFFSVNIQTKKFNQFYLDVVRLVEEEGPSHYMSGIR